MDRLRHAPRALAASLAAACVLSCGPASDGPQETFAETFDRVWSTVDQTYPYFEVKGIDWAAQRDAYRPRAEAARSEAELRAVIVGLLGELRDLHVNLHSTGGQFLPTYRPAVAWNWTESSWSASLARHGVLPGADTLVSGRIGTVGYLAIRSWATGAVTADAVDAALEPLRDTTALVVDVRMNGGGNDGIAFQVAGRFTAQAAVGSWIQYRDGPGHGDLGPLQARDVLPRGPWTYPAPVLLLVGRGCMSSCEGFVSAMRALDPVRLVGDPTRGSTGNPGTYPLRAGWTFTVSRWIQYTHDQLLIEGQGIPPAVALPWTQEALAADEDQALEGALALAAAP